MPTNPLTTARQRLTRFTNGQRITFLFICALLLITFAWSVWSTISTLDQHKTLTSGDSLFNLITAILSGLSFTLFALLHRAAQPVVWVFILEQLYPIIAGWLTVHSRAEFLLRLPYVILAMAIAWLVGSGARRILRHA